MKHKKLIALVVGFIAVTLFVLWTISFSRNMSLSTIIIGKIPLRVEVAQSPNALEKGLGGRDSIGSDGMLFILPQKSIPTFWMKDMKFPLDFIWIDGDKVVDITEGVLAPRASELESVLPRYSPKFLTTHVLEIPAGSTKKYGIQIGDSVTLRLKI
ncbi:MAG: DUF192 domain-containing protein [Candidatus Pacebacteria bacterium]|nr:DUF192 domain-containing protein [Candidatus Paceibacterota bacterium]